ncbi:hypothetical protein GCM10009783_48460 [Glycomyces lechevalierae]
MRSAPIVGSATFTMKASIEDKEAMRRIVNSPAPVRAGGAAGSGEAGGEELSSDAERGALAV